MLHLDLLLASIFPLYRDTAPVPIYWLLIPGQFRSYLASLYRDRACTQQALHLDSKNTRQTLLAPGQFTAPACGGLPGQVPGAGVGLRLLKHTAGPLGKMGGL